MDSYTFLINFFRGMTGQWIELTYIHPLKPKYENVIIDFVEVGNSPALHAALERASKLNTQGWGIYFGTCPRKALPAKGKRGSEDHVDTMLGFWTEIDSVKEGRLPEDDLKKIQAADFVPSFCVLSGGGVHAYWLFDAPQVVDENKRQLIKSALRGIGSKFGGDSAVAEFARVLRVPGFVNTKPGRDAAPVTFIPPTGKHRYSIDQLMTFAPPAEPVKPKRRSYRYEVTDAVEMARAALKVLKPSRFIEYAEWIEVGLCLSDLGPAGVALWDEFSSAYPNYEPGACEKFAKDWRGEKHLASLYRLANLDYGGTGWRPEPPQPFTVSNSLDILQTENQPKIDYWQTGLPVNLRAALAVYAHPAVAPVLELWCEGIAAGIIPGREITTVQCLLKVAKQLNRNTTEATIRAGLNQGCVQFLRILSHNSIGLEEGSIQDQITVTDNQGVVGGADTSDCDCPCKNPLKAGRDANYYELLTPREILVNVAKLAIVPILMEHFPPSNGMVAPIRAEFLALLGLEKADELSAELTKRYQATLEKQPGYQEAMDRARLEYKRLAKSLASPESAPIPAGRAYANSAQYMAACARAIIEREGGETQYSIGTWCNNLGCKERNLKAILTRAGIRVLKQQNVDVPVKSIDQLKAIQPTYCRDAHGFPKAVVSSVKSEPYGFTKRGLIAWAEGELAIGATLSVRYRQANRQTIEPDTTPVIKPKLTYFKLLAMKKLIAFLLANIQPDVESEPGTKLTIYKLSDFPTLWRWERLQRMSYMLAWYRRAIRPDVEVWTEVLAETVSAWKVKGDKMLDTSAGEIRTFTPQAAIEALAEMDVSPPPPPGEWADDPLVSALIAMGGVVVSVEATVGEVAA